MIEEIENCALTDELERHEIRTFHTNGRMYSGDLHRDGTVAKRFAFIKVKG